MQSYQNAFSYQNIALIDHEAIAQIVCKQIKLKKKVDFTINVFFPCRYCPECRNDASEVVLAGEKLKESKKKAKMASASSSSQRDWGKVCFSSTSLQIETSDSFRWSIHEPGVLFCRVWRVSAAPNSAPSFPPTITGPFLEFQWERCGSSECRWAFDRSLFVLLI